MTRAADWTANVGRVWAEEWRRTERAFAGIAATLDAAIAGVAPGRGRAVDIGCGAGSTTLALAAAQPGLHVTGVDLSASLAEIARGRVADAGLADAADIVAADAAVVVPRLAPLDLMVSRHGVMFFDDPVAGFATLERAMRRGAPLIFSCFRARQENDWASAVDTAIGTAPAATGYAPGPYALADRAFAADVLACAGWGAVRAIAHDIDYVVGAGVDPVGDALAFFRRIGSAAAILAAADTVERARLERRLADLCEARIRNGAVTFTAAIWIWTARAGKETA